MGHDFDGVARAGLARAEELLPRWIGGRRQAGEWVGERTRNGGIGDSWSINLKSGKWRHFAGNETGSDIISFHLAIFGGTMDGSRIEILNQLGGEIHSTPPILPVRQAAPEPRCDPIPEDAPELHDHPAHGRHSAEYRYGTAFRVTRYDTSNGKVFAQWTWRNGGWSATGYGKNRPLYQRHELDLHPTVPVLVVEGEKCVHAAAPVLTGYAVITWSGGVGGLRSSDWSALAGREVVIWPDADQPGRKAAADLVGLLSGSATRVRVVNPNGYDEGWDVANAVADGWDVNRLSQFMSEHFAEPMPAKGLSASAPEPSPSSSHSSESERTDVSLNVGSAMVDWVQMGLACDPKGNPFITLANASKILQLYENFQGNIWFDEFRGRVYHTLYGTDPQPWTDRETRRVTVAIQQQLQLPKFQLNLIHDAITHAAECHPRHSLRDWLDSLEWDGNERLENWLSDTAGVVLDEYTQAVGRNWLIAMVARAYKPGCKMDNMPVLEGVSGLKKTQFLGVLGGDWYKSLTMQFGEKDFLQALRGAWLIEIPDMAGFTRSEHTKVLATITTATDSYRVPYGRVPEDVPRTCVFAATSETDDYLSDSRGKRRYWPIRCLEIDLDVLRGMRDQLFAEAVQRYRNNATWYEVPLAAAAREQLNRTEGDEFAGEIIALANTWWNEYVLHPAGNKITAKRILARVLELEPRDISPAQCRRVTKALFAEGWSRQRDDYGFFWVKHLRPL